MKINFPSFNEYQSVLQSPAYCFNLPELKTSRIETDLWGLPRVRSGGFALTYKLSTPTRGLAVRCFHRHVPDRAYRYAAISNFLSGHPSDVVVPIRYFIAGIRVKDNWFPITFMPWIEGDTLETYLLKNSRQPELMQNLVPEFLHIVQELERLEVAHGDLSHRNILLNGTKMVLVDYDGMFVPGMEGRKSCEVGNIHFQLPDRRMEHFNKTIDRFSEIVIYLALKTLAIDPDLWLRYETGGEGLLFQREDFVNPYQSKLLRDIEAIPELAGPVAQFRRICTSPIELVPTLADFIEQKTIELPRSETRVKPVSIHSALDSAQRAALLGKAGKVVSVAGQVTEVFYGASQNGEPQIFLNFGDWQAKCFTIVLWNEGLKLLNDAGIDPRSYLNAWVCVTGVLTAYEHRPQITIDSPTDVLILHNSQEARGLIDRARAAKGFEPGPLDLLTAPTHGKEAIPYDLPIISKSQPGKSVRTLDQTDDVLSRLDALYAKQKKGS